MASRLSPGTGKSHLARAIGQAAIQQGYCVLYRETHTLLDELADATLDDTRKEHMEFLVTVPLLIIDDLGMRKLPLTAAEEIIMRRYERASAMLTSESSGGRLTHCAACAIRSLKKDDVGTGAPAPAGAVIFYVPTSSRAQPATDTVPACNALLGR